MFYKRKIKTLENQLRLEQLKFNSLLNLLATLLVIMETNGIGTTLNLFDFVSVAIIEAKEQLKYENSKIHR